MRISCHIIITYFYQMIIRPEIFDSKYVVAAQSTRLGGLSKEPFKSLNLGLSVHDDEKVVMENRKLFFNSLGISPSQVTKSHQVHGTDIMLVTKPCIISGYDGLISNTPGVFLAVSVADCTPILIYDEKNKAVAALHAGWRGTAGKIVSHALHLMNHHFGTQGIHCKAFIGACISYAHFETGPEVAEHFDDSVKHYEARKQKWFVDLKAANKNLLLRGGLLSENIELSNYCTVTNNDLFFSHRAEKGKTGRMMAVIGIAEKSV
jgi:polyphenol oxidase